MMMVLILTLMIPIPEEVQGFMVLQDHTMTPIHAKEVLLTHIALMVSKKTMTPTL